MSPFEFSHLARNGQQPFARTVFAMSCRQGPDIRPRRITRYSSSFYQNRKPHCVIIPEWNFAYLRWWRELKVQNCASGVVYHVQFLLLAKLPKSEYLLIGSSLMLTLMGPFKLNSTVSRATRCLASAIFHIDQTTENWKVFFSLTRYLWCFNQFYFKFLK